MSDTCILYFYAGPGCLINCSKFYTVSYHGCHIYLCPASPERAVTFLGESYKSVLERRYFISYINFMSLFVLPVSSFWYRQCNCSPASLWTVLRVVYDITWFHSGKSSEISSSADCSTSSVTALHCRHHCFFAMFSSFLETFNSLSFVAGSWPCSSGNTAVSILPDLVSCR